MHKSLHNCYSCQIFKKKLYFFDRFTKILNCQIKKKKSIKCSDSQPGVQKRTFRGMQNKVFNNGGKRHIHLQCKRRYKSKVVKLIEVLGYLFTVHSFIWCVGQVAQSVQRLATGWMVRGSNPGEGAIFCTSPDRPWAPSSLLYNGYRVFPGGKERPERYADPSPPSSAVVMKGQSYTSTPPMGRTACTEPQCLYKGALYLYTSMKQNNMYILTKCTIQAVFIMKSVINIGCVWYGVIQLGSIMLMM